jgi:hypothetical protein
VSNFPSGNFALVNHNHTSNDITDFNSSVSGLLPVKNISSGSGINVTNNSGNFVVSVTGSVGLTSEEVDDRVSNLLVGGSNIVLNYNDSANQLTISTSGLQLSGNYSVEGHTHDRLTNGDKEVVLDSNGNLRTPTNSLISKGYPGLTQDGSSWFVSPSGSLGGLASTDGQQYIQIGDNSEIYIGLGWPNNAVEWIFNRNGSLTLPSGLIFVDNTIQTTAWSGAVSINDITDFASGVSGLLPTVSGSGYAVTSFNNNIYSISVTGLQPSGNYSLDGHNHIIADVSGLQTALDNKQPSGIYASGIHYHVSADISDFTSSVSGLLPVIANSGDNRILTSTGSTVGVNAESNLTFDGNLLSVSGNLVAVATNSN